MIHLIKKTKKAIYTARHQGFGVFWQKSKFFLKEVFSKTVRPLYLVFFKKGIIKKIKETHIDKPEEAYDFLSKNFFGAFKPGQVPSELTGLLNVIHLEKPKIIVEIGTSGGGTLMSICKTAPPDAVICSIDLPGGRFGGGYPSWKIPFFRSATKLSQTVHFLRMDSHKKETLGQLKQILGEQKVDFLFIDGDHTYEGVKLDFQMYSPLVKKGGIVGFHDIVVHHESLNCGVHDFWAELCLEHNGRTREIIEDPGQGWAGIGLLHI